MKIPALERLGMTGPAEVALLYRTPIVDMPQSQKKLLNNTMQFLFGTQSIQAPRFFLGMTRAPASPLFTEQ